MGAIGKGHNNVCEETVRNALRDLELHAFSNVSKLFL
jgi:hypothetical protein